MTSNDDDGWSEGEAFHKGGLRLENTDSKGEALEIFYEPTHLPKKAFLCIEVTHECSSEDHLELMKIELNRGHATALHAFLTRYLEVSADG